MGKRPKEGDEMHNQFFRWGFLFALLPVFFVFFSRDAEALSQWARKYQVSCVACHTSFPRLNYFGEKFMRNGFQWPGDEPDGDRAGKEKLSEDLFIDKVGHWLGARLSFTPLDYRTNNRIENGKSEDSLDVGNPNWLQLFVGGSIFKNVSIFIEQEFESDGSKFSWFHLYFTNLAKTYANFQVGKLSPVDFSSFSDRLRIWQKSDVLNVKSSGGLGENSVTIRQSRPGVQYYGYSGPLILYAGVDNGKDASDTDLEKNYWVGLRLEVPDMAKSRFGGSSAGFHVYSGTDAANTATARVENEFMRYTISANARYEKSDVQLVYQIGEDENYDLASTPVKRNFQGFTVVGAYLTLPWYFVLQYDQIDSDDIPTIEANKISPSLWYFLRSNFKVGISSRIDVSGDSPEKHEVALQIRTMF
jgi:hypothetical protein